MNYSRRQLEALGETLGECVTRKEGGRVIYGGGGSGGGAPATQTQVSDLPSWAKPYAQETLGKAQALTDISQNPYQTYGGERIAGFTPMQQQAQEAAAGMGTAGQLGTGTGLASAAGLMGLGASYQPGIFRNQFRAPEAYQPSQFAMLQAQAPELQQFQMGPAERVGTGSFTQPGAAAQYMSPFIEQALTPQLREAQRTSEIQRAADQAQAVRSGAFGGSRQAIIEAERQRNLATQMGDIRARGLQTAFEQAQGLYGTEAQRQLAAQQANQQAGLTVGGQNLAALLGVQQLGAGQSMQAQLANQQALQAAQQAAEQSRQYGYGQGMTAAQQRAQFGQAAQQLAEQSRQYGAGYGLQGLGTALQAAGQLGQLGQAEFGQAMDINRLQQQVGAQQQALEQQRLGQSYQDFLNQQRYPYQQLEFMSNMLRGTPMGTVQTMYQPPASTLGQLAGLGIGLGGMAQFGKMFNEGGQVDGYADGGSVTSDYKVDEILGNLSDAQLQQARMAALNSRDMRRVAAIDEELAERTSLRSGLGNAFNSLPEETQEAVTEMATGGIVAFAGPTEDNNYSLVEDPQFGGGSVGAMEMDRIRIENELARRAAQEDEARMKFLKQSAPETHERLMAERAAKESPKPTPRAAAQAAPQAAPEAAAPRAARQPAVTRRDASEAVKAISEAARVQIPKDESKELTKTLFDELMGKSSVQQGEFKQELEAAKNRAKEIEARGIGEAMMKFGFTMAAAAAKPGAGRGLSGALKSAAAASPAFAESMAENAKLKQSAEDNYMKLRMETARYQTAVEQGNMQLAATLANNISQRQLAQATLQEQMNRNAQMFDIEREKLGIMRATRSDSSQPALVKIAERYLKEDPKLSFEQAMDKASRVAGYSFRSEQAGDLKRAELLSKFRKENPMYGMLVMQRDRAKTPEERAVFQQKIDVLESEAFGKLAAPSAAGVGSGQAYPGFRLVQ